MTANRRIFWNVVATYGRSLYSLAVGLLCGRWALKVLGDVDYGLYGLIGGLISFVAIFNELLSMSVMRFYSVSVGAAKKNMTAGSGLEECRKWFNTALFIHTVIPVILLAVGYPIGEWAVCNFLSIPIERIDACVLIWRLTCLTSFLGMVSVPFRAMYTAKQEIAELTIYGFVTTTLNALVLYYMISHPRYWLREYAFWQCLVVVAPLLIIATRAVCKYPEIRFCRQYLWNADRIKQIFVFAAARMWGSLTGMAAGQGRAILVNKFLGPAFNAAVAVGGTVASHSMTLSSSISSAFWPAIANKAGEGDEEGVKILMFRTSRLSTLMLLVFAVPLALEADEVLVLWLGTPPACSSLICVTVMAAMIMSRMTEGYWMAIMGLGRRVPYYSFIIGWAEIIGLAAAAALFVCGLGIVSVVASRIVAGATIVTFRVLLGYQIIGIPPGRWIKRVLLPVVVMSVGGLFVGSVTMFLMEPSFVRVCVTSVCCELVMLPLGWFVLLDEAEKSVLMAKAEKVLGKFKCCCGR